jgi:hypothetical protein
LKENSGLIRGDGDDHSDGWQREVPIRKQADTEWIYAVKQCPVDLMLEGFVVVDLDKSYCTILMTRKLSDQVGTSQRYLMGYWRT